MKLPFLAISRDVYFSSLVPVHIYTDWFHWCMLCTQSIHQWKQSLAIEDHIETSCRQFLIISVNIPVKNITYGWASFQLWDFFSIFRNTMIHPKHDLMITIHPVNTKQKQLGAVKKAQPSKVETLVWLIRAIDDINLQPSRFE